MMLSNEEKFLQAGEPLGATLVKYRDSDAFLRMSYFYKTYFENRPLPEYNGGNYYPHGTYFNMSPAAEWAIKFDRNFNYRIDRKKMDEKSSALFDLIADEADIHRYNITMHFVAGFGYCHSLPHYGRILREGFASYRERICKKEGVFREGLLAVLEGIDTYRKRCIAKLKESPNTERLIAALEQVPFSPARNIYEALVGYNFIYYLDFCDNVGRLDEDLLPFWKGEDIVDLLHEFFINVDESDGYSASVGPEYNGLTLQCLKAIKGLRRPQIELRVREDMPEEIWQAAIDSLAAGGTNPSLYNDKGFDIALHSYYPEMPREDFLRFCGVGCTEASLAGLTRSGSLDAGFHLPYIYLKVLKESLQKCESFEAFYQELLKVCHSEMDATFDWLDDYYTVRGKYRPNPLRTLMIDDCIDKGLDFNCGGARYSWSVINFAGMSNLIESMIATDELVYRQKKYTPEAFIKALEAEEESFFADCRQCPHYGCNHEEQDLFAHRLMHDIFDLMKDRRNTLGGKMLPSSIQFNTCVAAGEKVTATPDGRHNYAPLADSIAALHGNATEGITAMLNSVASLPLYEMAGTPVLNLKLEKNFLKSSLKPLILGFFSEGGMQVQISCLCREDMLDAMEHPENHKDLVVRVGGYSDYFIRLNRSLQEQVLSRTEFA